MGQCDFCIQQYTKLCPHCGGEWVLRLGDFVECKECKPMTETLSPPRIRKRIINVFRKCRRTHEIPYIPEDDIIQDLISTYKDELAHAKEEWRKEQVSTSDNYEALKNLTESYANLRQLDQSTPGLDTAISDILSKIKKLVT